MSDIMVTEAAYLTDVRLSRAVSLSLCRLFWAERKFSFWMASHVLRRLAFLPRSSRTDKGKENQIGRQEIR